MYTQMRFLRCYLSEAQLKVMNECHKPVVACSNPSTVLACASVQKAECMDTVYLTTLTFPWQFKPTKQCPAC